MIDRPIRVRLDEVDFRRLCAGQVVELHSIRGLVVQLILSDSGWDRMRAAIDDAQHGLGDG